MSNKYELWKGTAKILKKVKNSWLIAVGDKTALIPQSMIHDDSEVYSEEHSEGELVIPLWLAVDRGIENFGEDYTEL